MGRRRQRKRQRLNLDLHGRVEIIADYRTGLRKAELLQSQLERSRSDRLQRRLERVEEREKDHASARKREKERKHDSEVSELVVIAFNAIKADFDSDKAYHGDHEMVRKELERYRESSRRHRRAKTRNPQRVSRGIQYFSALNLLIMTEAYHAAFSGARVISDIDNENLPKFDLPYHRPNFDDLLKQGGYRFKRRFTGRHKRVLAQEYREAEWGYDPRTKTQEMRVLGVVTSFLKRLCYVLDCLPRS